MGISRTGDNSVAEVGDAPGAVTDIIFFVGTSWATAALARTTAAKRADLSNKDFKDALALEPSASIPYDPETFGKALNTGEMMSKVSAKNKATVAIAEFAKVVSAREEAEEEGGKKKIFALFNKKKD